jgi:ClpP class serine protease
LWFFISYIPFHQGVVTAKFNAEKLIEKIGMILLATSFATLIALQETLYPGFKEETISIGRYAELLTTSRGFTADEQQQFESFGQQAYRSFVSKVSCCYCIVLYDQLLSNFFLTWSTGRCQPRHGI